MGAVNTFYKIVLNAANSPSDYPRGYQVNVSNDGITWGSPVTNGIGSSAITTITFPTQTARYIRITQTGSAPGSYWSIHEFYVFFRRRRSRPGWRSQALPTARSIYRGRPARARPVTT